jgi:hypothetical protein
VKDSRRDSRSLADRAFVGPDRRETHNVYVPRRQFVSSLREKVGLCPKPHRLRVPDNPLTALFPLISTLAELPDHNFIFLVHQVTEKGGGYREVS